MDTLIEIFQVFIAVFAANIFYHVLIAPRVEKSPTISLVRKTIHDLPKPSAKFFKPSAKRKVERLLHDIPKDDIL